MTASEYQLHPQTLAIRSGHQRTAQGEHSEPIYATSSFVFASAEQAAARFAGDDPGNVYSRFTNPSVEGFAERLAALEGANYGVAVASGMAAISAVCLGLLRSGDHIVASRALFGTTTSLFSKVLPKFGITTTFVDDTAVQSWRDAFTPATRLVYLETPSNPLCQVIDIQAIADITHEHDGLLVVDNAFATPVFQQPLRHGADIVVHTATKYLDGQGRCVGGAIICNDDKLHDEFIGHLRTLGPSMSPFNGWVFSKGLETLHIRMQAHAQNAMTIAQALQETEGVEAVYYPGLPSHPQHELAARQLSGFGGIVAFKIKGGTSEVHRLINRIKWLSITANLGDSKTTITHPATTTHGRLSEQERAQAGVTDNLIRLSVGLEHVDDILQDIKQAMA